MNIPQLVERLNAHRPFTAMEQGFGAVVRDGRNPFIRAYIMPASDAMLVRVRYEYAKPDAKTGLIRGLNHRQTALVRDHRIVEATAVRVADPAPDAAITAILDRLNGQLKPHEIMNRASSRRLADAWRGLLDDTAHHLDDAVTAEDRRLLTVALASPAGPALLNAMLADAADGGHRTANVKTGDRPDTHAVGTVPIVDRARLTAGVRAATGMVDRIPGWRIRQLRGDRRDWTTPITIMTARIRG